jgi:hypothetical protein
LGFHQLKCWLGGFTYENEGSTTNQWQDSWARWEAATAPWCPWLGERGGPIADARLAACNEDDDGSNMFEPTIFFTDWWFGTFFIFPYIGNNHPK